MIISKCCCLKKETYKKEGGSGNIYGMDSANPIKRKVSLLKHSNNLMTPLFFRG